MNKNVKKMIVMLGIVLGSTAMAITVQLGVWGWVPIELYKEYRDECESIPHAYWYENDMGSSDGILSVHGICTCSPGYMIDYEHGMCIRQTE